MIPSHRSTRRSNSLLRSRRSRGDAEGQSGVEQTRSHPLDQEETGENSLLGTDAAHGRRRPAPVREAGGQPGGKRARADRPDPERPGNNSLLAGRRLAPARGFDTMTDKNTPGSRSARIPSESSSMYPYPAYPHHASPYDQGQNGLQPTGWSGMAPAPFAPHAPYPAPVATGWPGMAPQPYPQGHGAYPPVMAPVYHPYPQPAMQPQTVFLQPIYMPMPPQAVARQMQPQPMPHQSAQAHAYRPDNDAAQRPAAAPRAEPENSGEMEQMRQSLRDIRSVVDELTRRRFG